MFNELQTAMLRTAHLDEPQDRAFSLCGLGLAGEAGEVADLVKKIFYHGKPFDRDKLIEEGGDLAWYIAYLAHTLGFGLDDLIDGTYHYNNFQGLPDAQKYTRIGNLLTSRAGRLAERLDYLVFEAPHHLSVDMKYLKSDLASLFGWLEALSLALDTSLQAMCRVNIAKLEKRYPSGFNTADSLARKDEVNQN